MASIKTKEKSQTRIVNFFNKTVATDNAPKSSIGHISSDVIPASPLNCPKRKCSTVSFSGRRTKLHGVSSVKEYFTKVDNKQDLTVCIDGLQGNLTNTIQKKTDNGVDGFMSLNRSRSKNCSEVQNGKEHGLRNAATTVTKEEDKVSTAAIRNDGSCGKEAKSVMNPLNDKCHMYYYDEAKQGKAAITNESPSKKCFVHAQGIKRVANNGSSGLSPVKKKHALSAGVMSKIEKCNKQIEIIDSRECTRRLNLKKGNLPAVKGAISSSDLLKDSTVEQGQLDSSVHSNSTEISRTSQNVLEVPKLKSSLKVSKKSAKKLRTLSKVSGSTKSSRELPSQSSMATGNFSDDEDELSIVRDYVKDSSNLVRNQASHSDNAAIFYGTLQDPSTRQSDHSDMKNTEEVNIGIIKRFAETEIALDTTTCPSIRAGDNTDMDEAIFNASKDNFPDIISKPDFSLTECKQDLPYCDTVSSENVVKKQFELDDSLIGIEFGDEMNTRGLASKYSDDRQYQKINFTVKPKVVIEVQTKERDNVYKVNEKILKLFDEDTFQSTKCILREDWETVTVYPGDLAYLTGNNLDTESTVTLDNYSNRFLILFPHTLVSGTTISMGITCQRQAVLSELFKTSGPNEVMLLGTIMHEVFDFVIKEKVVEKKVAEKKLRELLSQNSYLNLLYSLDIDTNNLMEKAREMLTSLCNWAKKYLKDAPHSTDGKMDITLGRESDTGSDMGLSISSIADIEENIICPSLGLKGKVDASMNVKIHRSAKRMRGNLNSVQELCYPVPLELKTGKMFSKLGSIEHRAQVILYALMMSEKYDSDIEAGLLYYMRTGHLQGVEASRKEKRSLILSRNQIARFLSFGNQRSHTPVPGLLRNDRVCRRCPVAPSCMVFHKSVEGGSKETSGVGDLFEEFTDHLKSDEINYFTKWFHLIMLEVRAETISNGRGRIWMKTSKEKEDERKCFRDMCIQTEFKKAEDLWIYTFQKNRNSSDIPLTEIRILKGDRVMISEENCKTFGLCFGYIESVTASELHIWCNERIRPRANVGRSYFRIEKDESLSSYKIPLANIMKLVLFQSEEDKRLRRLVVSLAAPRFDLSFSNDIIDRLNRQYEDNEDTQSSKQDGQQLLLDDSQLAKINSIYKDLNPDQKVAVSRCLAAKDYLMILGMPGTGKTTTIACIISILVTLGKSVLVASYTHTAVDNILIKVKQMKLDFVRLGQQHKVREEIKPFVVENATCHIKTVKELEQFYERTNIVATTCLGINHPILTKKRFDFCIVDEASQITQPVCLGAIRCANTFILVGDHYQLPPLVQSIHARNSGMDISLFKLLSEKHPSAIVRLRYQYRMNEDIMMLANELIYGHRMQCADKAPRVLNLPRFAVFQEQNQGSALDSFIARVISPSQPVIFINSDSIPCPESTTGSHIHNEYEAKLVAVILQSLIECGAEPEDIGIVSPLRQQLKTIEYSLRKTCFSNLVSRIEMNTVDKYQGRDKSCIIVSFVRSNNSGNVGELLKDWRRINVAITRSKHKLVMIGSKETLSFSLILNELLNLIESKYWIIPAEKSWLTHFEKGKQLDLVEQTCLV